MKKLFLSLLLVILYSCSAMAGASKHTEPTNVMKYVEGEVLVLLEAPAAQKYSIMGKVDKPSYSRTITSEADIFAKKLKAEAKATYPTLARRSGNNIILIRWRTKQPKN